MTDVPQGRISLREKSGWWVASWAAEFDGTTRDTIELCRIRYNVVCHDAEIKTAFMELAKMIIAKGIEAAGASIDYWGEPREAEPER